MTTKETYENGLLTYEDSFGFWEESTFEDRLLTYYKDSSGYWAKSTYEDELRTYYENSDGDWEKVDDDGTVTYGKLKIS